MLISEGDAVPRARIVLSAPSRSASCSVSSFLSTQLGRNVSGRPQIFWFPWWPTTITSPRICRWKSAAETSLPEVQPSGFRGVGPMFEDFLLVPEESVQVRQPKVADPAPEDENMGRCDRVDRVQLNVAEVANHGEDRIPCRTGRSLASKMLLRDSEAPRGFQG